MMLHKKSEKGQAIIMIIFAIIGLVALTGLTVDGGRAYADRRQAQGAADSAAWAAALAKARGMTNLNIESAAKEIADQNGYSDDVVRSVVTVTPSASPVGTCPTTGTDYTVEITSYLDTFFAPVIGVQQVTNRVEASTRSCDVTGGVPFYTGHSVFATKVGSCGNGLKDKTLYVQGSSSLQVWGGDMGSASADGNCIAFTGGETQLKKQESGTACADITTAAPSSEASDADFSKVSGQDGCGAHVFGQAFDAAPANLGITCSGNAAKSGSSMSPGNYTGSFPPSGVTTLNPGVYCINGDFTVNSNADLTGTGVTIVLNSGNLKWNGSAEIKLSAPTSGNTKGLLIYLPPGNVNDVDVNGSSNAKITGTVMAQDSDCFFAGSGQLQKQTIQFVCSTWGMDGNGQAEIVYDSSAFYAPLVMPSISLIK